MTVSLDVRTGSRPALSFDAPRVQPERLTGMLMVIGGLFAALLNTSAPAGIALADAAYRAVFVAGVIFLTTRARRWTWVWLAAIATIATASLIGQILCTVALGVAVGALQARRRGAIGALVAAVAMPALLAQGVGPLERLTSGELRDTFGTSAIIAVVAIAPIIRSGYPRLTRRQRRRVRRVVRPVAAVLALVTIGTGLVLASAFSPILEARELTLDAADTALEGDIDEATLLLADAGEQWAVANRRVAGFWTLPGRLVPVVGQHLRAAQIATGQSAAVSSSASIVASRFDGDRLVEDGRLNLEEIDALRPAVDALAATTTRAELRVADAVSPWLIPPVRSKFEFANDRLGPLSGIVGAVSEGLHVGTDLVGGSDESTILVLFSTPAESRGGGGFIGNWAEFTAADGELKLTANHRSKYVNDLLIERGATLRADADYETRYGRFSIENHVQDVTLSPDFPSAAAVAADLYEQATDRRVDAVFMVDPSAISALLAFTGPVTVDDGYTINTNNAQDELLIGQYERYADDDGARTEVLAELASTIVSSLLEEPPDLVQFSQELAPLAEQGRIAAWLANDANGEISSRLGLDGAFPRASGDTDVLGVVHQNAGQNKIDTYLTRTVEVDTILDTDAGLVDHLVRVTLRNDAPTEGLPDAIIGSNDQGLVPGTNRLTLSVYSPHTLRSAWVDDVGAAVESGEEFGLGVYSMVLVLPPESSTTIEMRFSGPMTLEDTYNLDVHAQPTANPDELRWRIRRADSTVLSAAGWQGDGSDAVLSTTMIRPLSVSFGLRK
ncbi:MAG: DUF4012 domain-containing protein [Acidimicrobiales bacterium]|nr:MAG: DUF4012 domain-containing protein [Acidimicrobiales bacterium]